MTAGTVICRLPGDDKSPLWGVFSSPIKVIETRDVDKVCSMLAEVESCLSEGKFAAGFISYEASPAFDDAHIVKDAGNFPLLWFGIYDSSPDSYIPDKYSFFEVNSIGSNPELTENEYISSVRKIEDYIMGGDIYQANYTFRSEIVSSLKPYQMFQSLFKSHPVPYAAYINTGSEELVSISPELFLEKNGSVLRSLPMKGTAHRELNAEEDFKAAEELSKDPKNCAENIMIVDMVRNDFGRICKFGSIKAEPIFHVDTYSTVHQMISGVQGTLHEDITLPEIFAATFPAASITGAPKIRAMQIINELEKSPRKVYTGTIGCIVPGGDFCFNVAIRTLICSTAGVELGIGSGIVADSKPQDEWRESLLKSTFIYGELPEFELLETILWSKKSGFSYFNEHLKRLQNSHIYFKWEWDREKIIAELSKSINGFSTAKFARVRLKTSQNGNVTVDIIPLDNPGWGKDSLKIKLSKEQTNSRDLFLYHKTTNRSFYNRHFKQALSEGFDEVVFLNEKNEITEGAISNIFIRNGEKWFTPPIKSGLLCGIWRSANIAKLNAEERILYADDLNNANEVLIGNSVRGSANPHFS